MSVEAVLEAAEEVDEVVVEEPGVESPVEAIRDKAAGRDEAVLDKKAGGVLQKLRNSCHKGYSWNQKGRKSCKS